MRYLDPNVERKNKLQDNHILKAPKLANGEPIFSHIEFSICGLCNRTCVFCPRSDKNVYPNKTEYLSIELYEKILLELKAVNYTGRLSYSGFSEPFYHKKLNDMIRLTKEYLPNGIIEIITNGDMLTPIKLKNVYDAGLDRLLISMYDGAEQISAFRQMEIDAEIPQNWLLLRERYLSSEENYGINLTNRSGMATAISDILPKQTLPLENKCYYTHYRMMIDHTGDALMCPHDWGKKYIAGNLNDENIIDVWLGDKLGEARRRLANANRNFSPCNVCDVEGTLQGVKHFEMWQNYNSKR